MKDGVWCVCKGGLCGRVVCVEGWCVQGGVREWKWKGGGCEWMVCVKGWCVWKGGLCGRVVCV